MKSRGKQHIHAIFVVCLISTVALGDLDSLMGQLGAVDSATRARAAREIGALGAQGAPAIEALIALLRTRPPREVRRSGVSADVVSWNAARLEAARALGQIGPSAASTVIPLLRIMIRQNETNEFQDRLSDETKQALARFGEDGRRRLLWVLQNRPQLRIVAIIHLGQFVGTSNQAMRALMGIVANDGDAEAREHAAGSLINGLGEENLRRHTNRLIRLVRAQLQRLHGAQERIEATQLAQVAIDITDALRNVPLSDDQRSRVRRTLQQMTQILRAGGFSGAQAAILESLSYFNGRPITENRSEEILAGVIRRGLDVVQGRGVHSEAFPRDMNLDFLVRATSRPMTIRVLNRIALEDARELITRLIDVLPADSAFALVTAIEESGSVRVRSILRGIDQCRIFLGFLAENQ